MDTLVKLVQVLAPLVTLGVAVLGLTAWYWQLADKRKFEVAEQAIITGTRIADALSRIRRIFVSAEELRATSISDDTAPAQEIVKALRLARAINKRVDDEQEVFAGARSAQIVASLYLTKEVGEALQVLSDARFHILNAAQDYALAWQSPMDNEEQRRALQERVRKDENVFWEIRGANREPHPDDRLSAEIDIALAKLTEHCTPFLRYRPIWKRRTRHN